jgi:hypothetical protein
MTGSKEKPDREKTTKDEIPEEKLEDVSGGKLTIGKPKDASEREADTAADNVLK